MGLYSLTHQLLKESGLSDSDLEDMTGIDKRWINRFRNEKITSSMTDRVEAIHKVVKKETAKQRRKLRARK